MISRKLRICLTALLVLVISIVSVIPSQAVTLLSDGVYTYADIDEYNLSLYNYDSSLSTVLTVPASYNNKFVSSIYQYAFEDNESITQIDFSGASRRLESIGIRAFAGCTGLTGDLALPSSVRSIGLAAFQGCTNISSVTINSNITEVPTQCFNRCTLLSKVYLPISAERIENLAFANCGYLDDVYFPTTVKYISDTAFMNSNFVRFHVWYGSYAHQYAIDNNIRYTLLDGVKLGDVDGDGDITITDATAIQRYLAELETLDAIHLYAADANEDKEVDIADATAIQMAVAKIPTGHPIGEVITK